MNARTRLVCALAATACTAIVAAPALAADRVVTATGKTTIGGNDVYVEVFLSVPPGVSERAAKRRALRQQDARPVAPPRRAAYAFTGLEWETMPVVQSYNSSGAPVDAAGTLQATEATWSTVSGSRLRMSYGGETTRCPSLSNSCSGGLDGFNDVGWERQASNVLGVTSFSISPDEADMTLNVRQPWSLGCQDTSAVDLQTVMLHENGHVVGLDHSSDPGAIMYPSYRGVQCELGADDEAGIRALYPAGSAFRR